MSNSQTKKEEILTQLNWRYAVKQYDPAKKISDTDWETLEEALSLAPSSFGLQPYKFIVITDEAIREKLVRGINFSLEIMRDHDDGEDEPRDHVTDNHLDERDVAAVG